MHIWDTMDPIAERCDPRGHQKWRIGIKIKPKRGNKKREASIEANKNDFLFVNVI